MDAHKLMAQRRAAEQKRRQEAAARFDDGLAALNRLVKIAKGDTGQSRRVADFEQIIAEWRPELLKGH
jgi:hypothetical protein